jgi:hypothetical protein
MHVEASRARIKPLSEELFLRLEYPELSPIGVEPTPKEVLIDKIYSAIAVNYEKEPLEAIIESMRKSKILEDIPNFEHLGDDYLRAIAEFVYHFDKEQIEGCQKRVSHSVEEARRRLNS